MFKKKFTELTVEELKKMRRVLIGILIGLIIVWIIVLSIMFYNGKNFSIFIAVACATMLPNFINLLNITNIIKKKENS